MIDGARKGWFVRRPLPGRGFNRNLFRMPNRLKSALRLIWSELPLSGIVLGAVTIAALGLKIYWGNEAAQNQLVTYLESIAWGVLSLVVVFVWHFFHTVPFRLIEEENSMLRARIPNEPVARSLSSEQKARLAELVRDWSTAGLEINVLHALTSGEALDFAADISEALRDGGARSVAHSGPLFDHNARARGLLIYYGSDRTEWAKQMQDRFFEFGFSPSRVPSDKPESLFIYVARAE